MMNKIYLLFITACCILLAFSFSCESKESKTVFNLKDFGAIPDDGEDDSEAFMLALNKCREKPGSILVIPPGNYNYSDAKAMEFEYKGINGQYGEDVQGYFFKPKGEYVIALDLDNFRDITIEAEGATLVQEGWYEAVSITNAKNVEIKGLKLTHKRPPFTTGEVIESTTTYFDMKIDTALYPYLTDKITGRVHYYDVKKQRIYTGNRVEKKELLPDGQTVRIYTQTRPGVGDMCILRHCAHNRAGILIKESSGITLENVTIHSQPGMGIVGHRSENIVMRNLQVIPAPGTVTSSNTDATHFTSCKGKILFDACKFGGQGDDCTNIHNYYWSIYKESGNDVCITVENADLHALSLDYPDVGDTLALVSKDKLTPVEYYIAQKVSTSVEDWKVVVTLDKPIKYDVNEYYMSNLTRRPSVDILNNTVRSHMARAFLIKTRNVRIAGNVVQSSSGSAIQLGAEAGWREGAPVENVVIENNWFIDCGYGHGRQSGSTISAEVNGIRKTTDRLNKNIIIRNNVIQAVGETAIYISDTDGVEIRDNEISGSNKAIQVKNSVNVDIKNNGALAVEQ
ncbi:right-handed parallel beta-helix repeat-containing protein [Dysgonomonas sp. GY75]|uniref:right-handed parallel beta-helix repeat-containing protein n=1 Tax=Dysgonomonas sp. GY75 TaxID=2780419 RepID=UPI00188478A8|nr:right-handed parallel beta-helix repeat-containing protein [Dysgonomonas sp. GY75]MBF0650850.1 right-handed parallel beta-helix repeat-containing protein [Dysgonomonas sp. GY75]